MCTYNNFLVFKLRFLLNKINCNAIKLHYKTITTKITLDPNEVLKSFG